MSCDELVPRILREASCPVPESRLAAIGEWLFSIVYVVTVLILAACLKLHHRGRPGIREGL